MGQADDELAHAQYWDERYKNENGEELETYDWFRTWEQLETWFRSHLMSEELIQPQILHLGCGNSVRGSRCQFFMQKMLTKAE